MSEYPYTQHGDPEWDLREAHLEWDRIEGEEEERWMRGGPRPFTRRVFEARRKYVQEKTS